MLCLHSLPVIGSQSQAMMVSLLGQLFVGAVLSLLFSLIPALPCPILGFEIGSLLSVNGFIDFCLSVLT